MAGIAEANGAIMRLYDGGDVHEDASQQKWIPRVAAVTRSEKDFGALSKSQYWPIRKSEPNQRVWTDDYSDIVGPVLSRLQERSLSSMR